MAGQRSRCVVDHVVVRRGGQLAIWRQQANCASQRISRILRRQCAGRTTERATIWGRTQQSTDSLGQLPQSAVRDCVSSPHVLFDKDQSPPFGTCSKWISSSPHSTMKFFAHARTQRNTVCVMLLVWLFAVVASAANACLLDRHAANATVANDSMATTSSAPAEHLLTTAIEAGHHDESDASKAACLKVCDDRTRTLVKPCSGINALDPGPAWRVATLWIAPLHAFSAPHRADGRAVPIVGPPLRVRYSRLAL